MIANQDPLFRSFREQTLYISLYLIISIELLCTLFKLAIENSLYPLNSVSLHIDITSISVDLNMRFLHFRQSTQQVGFEQNQITFDPFNFGGQFGVLNFQVYWPMTEFALLDVVVLLAKTVVWKLQEMHS